MANGIISIETDAFMLNLGKYGSVLKRAEPIIKVIERAKNVLKDTKIIWINNKS